MRAELVSIPTDAIPLDGLYYEPEGKATGAALLFHGNTMNFYVGAPRFLPPVLVKLGLACLTFNRRGHDILSTRASRIAEGGAYQLAHEGIEDNRLTETRNTLDLAPKVKCPTLYVRGDREPRASSPAEDFKARAGGPCTVEIVPDCDHFYNGREEQIQAIVSSWLAKVLHLDATEEQKPSHKGGCQEGSLESLLLVLPHIVRAITVQ